jgi:DNA-binding CsgD family transcriptional regulator
MVGKGTSGNKELPQTNPGAIEIRDLLLRRAKERSAAQRWNGYTLILTYAVLATITILAVRSVGTPQLAGVAVLGLALIWSFSRFQARRTEAQSLRDELRAYSEQLAKQPPDRSNPVATPAPGGVDDSPLTGREMQVLRLVAAGKSNKETAHSLNISDQTVKNHLSHIFVKLSVSDRTSAALLAVNRGWIEVANPDTQRAVLDKTN